MRILFITNHLKGTDGSSRVSLDFALELQNLGHAIFCLTCCKSDQKEIKEIPLLENPLKYLANPLNSFLTALKVQREIEKFSPDIVHFMVEPYATLVPFLKIKKTKTVLTIHGTYSVIPVLVNGFFKKIISNHLSKKYYQKMNGIIAVSNYTKEYLLKYYPQLKEKVRVITNGVNLERHKILFPLATTKRRKIKKILFVGLVKKRKGILETIEALRYYRDNFSSNFTYDIVGSYNQNDSYYRHLLKKIREYHLEDKIFFRGEVTNDELERFYSQADLFMMTSININHNFEGFGIVFLEANAKGIPVIGPKDSGCPEAIKDGKTGYIVDPFNFKQIAHKMDLILNQNAILPQDCIDWAKQNDLKIKIKELIDFYQCLIK